MALFGKVDNLGSEPVKDNKITDVEKVKVLVVGSGPAGYTAAIYAARATTTEVENYPGYPEGITGPEMMEDFKKQAERFGTSVRFGMATKADLSKRPYKVTIDDKKIIEADSLIIATGATAKYLGLEDEKKYAGGGVSACATCDGFFYKGRDVAVVGGGDTAAEEALYLSALCNQVYMIVRRDELRASKVMQDRVFNTKNIKILWKHQVKGLFGDGVVEGAVLVKNLGTKEEEEVKIKIDGFFLAIGHTPNSDIFKDYLETDDIGYIKTLAGTSKTNVPGVFACGDVQDNKYRQAVTAAGSGCIAAIDAERWLAENH